MSDKKIRAALEIALDGLAGLIPAVSVLTSSGSVFVTSAPHLLKTDISAKVTGHVGSTPAVSGSYLVTVLSSTTFSLRDELTKQVVTLSVGGTGGSIKANLTAWENTSFSPVVDVPYQKVNLLKGKPENPSIGDSMVRKIGIMQVTLYYPKQRGTADIETRTELLETTFKRGATFSNNGVLVKILESPETIGGNPQDNSYVAAVRIPYQTDIFT